MFISYSGDHDRKWLPRLQRAIEKQSRPWYKPPQIRAFLADNAVSIGPQLWSKIEAGLARSEWLVVMASPESKLSVWVDREIEWWLKNKTADHILLVVTSGQLVWNEQLRDWDPELSTALPARLFGQFEDEPVWKSVGPRRPDDGTDAVREIDDIALGIASVVRGLSEEDLKSEGLHDTKRNLRVARIVAAVLGALVLVVSTVSVIALTQRDEAIRQRDRAVAQQLIAQSGFLATRDPFGARLTALAAWQIDPSPQSRLAVLDAAVNPQSGILTGISPVGTVAFGPDGRTIASGGDDGVVRLWDAATQQEIDEPFVGHNQGVRSVVFSHDGRMLASSSSDGTARLWSVADHAQIGDAFNAQAGTVNSVAISPDGKTLVTADEEGMRIWDVATRRQTGEHQKGHSRAVAFSPDGKVFVSVSHQSVQFWETASRARIGDPLAAEDPGSLTSVSFSPDGKAIAVGGTDGSVRLWDTDSRALIGEPLAAGDNWVRSVAFGQNGATLAVSYEDGSVRVWDRRRQSQIGAPFIGHTSTANAVAFSPDGSTLASSSDDTTIRLWDVRVQRQTGEPIDTGTRSTTALSPDGRILAAMDSPSLRFWDVPTRRQIGDPLRLDDPGLSGVLAFSPDSAVLAIADGYPDHAVRFWDVSTRRQIGDPIVLGRSYYVNAMAFSPDGQALAVSGGTLEFLAEGSVRLWAVATRRPIGRALDGAPDRITFSPDGRALATNGGHNAVVFWDVAADDGSHQMPSNHNSDISALTYSPDGAMIATTSRDQTVRLWDVAKREQIGEPLTGHLRSVTSVTFSPTGETLATGSADGTVRLWDVATHRQIGDPLVGHGYDAGFAGDSAGVTGVGFSPDGRTLISWGEDATARIWNVEATAHPQRSVCAWARGAFTADRWRAYVPAGPAVRQLCPA